MTRFAKSRRVFYWEEPLVDTSSPSLNIQVCPKSGVVVVTPLLSGTQQEHSSQLRELFAQFLRLFNIQTPVAWFYTPMALEFAQSALQPSMIVYDCMDELSLFRGAPPEMIERERELIRIADVVFTGGVSLYEAKRRLHGNAHAFPSGVDLDHFKTARKMEGDVAEQNIIAHPRIGYAGVIDERIDLALIEETADRKPDWHIVMIGPTAKIDPASLPRRSNIHWLGQKSYDDLPKYFSGWDVAIMPFALNDSTRFISPTKTPEYLSAGRPVVSTAIRDVIRSYADLRFVQIAGSASEFVSKIEEFGVGGIAPEAQGDVDSFLRQLSWDSVWTRMNELLVTRSATSNPEIVAKPQPQEVQLV